jgi:hypothetical protein
MYEDDPCIAGLPGVKYACCGHGASEGYIFFENGIAIRFSGAEAIERRFDDGESVNPKSARFWKNK